MQNIETTPNAEHTPAAEADSQALKQPKEGIASTCNGSMQDDAGNTIDAIPATPLLMAPAFEIHNIDEETYTRINGVDYSLEPRHREILHRNGLYNFVIYQRGYFSLPSQAEQRTALLSHLGFEHVAHKVNGGVIAPLKHEVLQYTLTADKKRIDQNAEIYYKPEYDYVLYTDDKIYDEEGALYPYIRSQLSHTPNRLDIPYKTWDTLHFMVSNEFDRRILWCNDVLTADFLSSQVGMGVINFNDVKVSEGDDGRYETFLLLFETGLSHEIKQCSQTFIFEERCNRNPDLARIVTYMLPIFKHHNCRTGGLYTNDNPFWTQASEDEMSREAEATWAYIWEQRQAERSGQL